MNILILELVFTVMTSYYLCRLIDIKTNYKIVVKKPYKRLILFNAFFMPLVVLFAIVNEYISEYLILPFFVLVIMFLVYFTIIKYLPHNKSNNKSNILVRHNLKEYAIPILFFFLSTGITIWGLYLFYKNDVWKGIILVGVSLILDIFTFVIFLKINKRA